MIMHPDVVTEPGGTSDPDERLSRIFTHGTLIACMILQRFGILLGGSALFISLPLFGMLLAWAFIVGIARVRRLGSTLYFGFIAWTLIVAVTAYTFPDARFGLSLFSLIAIILTYALTIVGPSERFSRPVVFETFLTYARICAVAGIVQWLIQFVGIRIFSFMLTVPALKPILVEIVYNYNPLMHYGSTVYRSNGFFLMEPSIMSQVMAFAMVVDYLVLGRAKFLPLYLVAYLLTFSGTGALSLALAVPFYAMQSTRNLVRVATLALIGVVAIGIAAVVVPDQVGDMLGRTNELSYSGSSGYLRFIGPYTPIIDLSGEARLLIGWGPGATERYVHHVEETGSSIAKLIMDYGVIGLIAFLTMLIGTLWRRRTAIVSVLAITTFVAGGGYLLFVPILVMMFLLCIWSGLPASSPVDNDAEPEPSSLRSISPA